VRTAMVLDRTRPKEEEDRFAFKPLENHVNFVLSYVPCTLYGKPPRIIPPYNVNLINANVIIFLIIIWSTQVTKFRLDCSYSLVF
jgi:hypothetical protein